MCRFAPSRRQSLPLGVWPARPGPGLSAYLALLPVGFAMPSGSPRTRCALTAPFHPYRKRSLLGFLPAVCFLLHFPSDCSALTLSSTGPYRAAQKTPPAGSSDFPHPDESGRDRRIGRDNFIIYLKTCHWKPMAPGQARAIAFAGRAAVSPWFKGSRVQGKMPSPDLLNP